MTTWDNIFDNWARVRGHGVTVATFAMIGTPGYVEAHKRFKAGGSEKVVQVLLDKAYSDTR